MDYWTEDNPDAFYPRLYPGSGTGTVSGVVKAFIISIRRNKLSGRPFYSRFKNLTIGYTLPQELTKKWYLQKVRFYFTAENLCELINNSYAPVDPENRCQ